MDLRRISDPLTLEQKLAVVTLDEAKAQARVRHTDEDDLIKGYVAAAFDFLHGPDGWLNGYCILEESFEFFVDRVDTVVELPVRPVVDDTLVSFEGREARGAYAAIAAGDFMIALVDEFATLARLTTNGFAAQPGLVDPRRYRIRFAAGWSDAAHVPSTLKQAIKMLAAHFYASREVAEPAGRGGALSREVEYGLRALAGRHRVSPDHS
ncbi:phage gp6-like head-tail connector protein [Methylobacterium sp. NMS14P]|uniref:head-tail connector protein n=1 Tax=Methylobacterium sp. NMS14P TaxID=2894310 RepID=UPI0023582A55|nr:head-tail connector protein [Methylobacterium sp. NMS14P]WCS27793.1 phage gp6-like head-tail connector protein [Methylobacterium sp. NMS14P]